MSRLQTLSFLATGICLLLLGLSGCDNQSPNTSSEPNRFSLTVQVEDASGAPVADAQVGVRPCYRFGNGLGCGSSLRRSAERSESPDADVPRPASQHPTPSEPVFEAPFPNPFVTSITFAVASPEPALFRSTLHTLDGTVVDTIAENEACQTCRFRFKPEGIPSGLYEQRSRLRVDGAVTARDTHYVALRRAGPSRPPFGPAGTALLGTTDADGTLTTTNRARFPSLYSLPTITVRDTDGVILDTLQVASSVQFVVEESVGAEKVGFPRVVTADTDAITLSVP